MAPAAAFACQPFGDAGVLVTATSSSAEVAWRNVHGLAAQLRARQVAGVEDVVATFDTVFVSFDPHQTSTADLIATIQHLPELSWQPRLSQFRVPVRYGGSAGPDAAEVAQTWGWSITELIDWHTSRPWLVRAVGSPLGAPLLEPLPSPYTSTLGWEGTHPALAPLPRLAAPRAQVAPGSVGLAGGQSIIYNGASPGGWQLIGTTPLRLFTPPAMTPSYPAIVETNTAETGPAEPSTAEGSHTGDEPASVELVAYQPGDVFWFVTIDTAEFARRAGQRLLATPNTH